jgi:hypothetical protein
MDKELIEFLNGDRNFYVGELNIGREKTSKTEFIVVGSPSFDKPLYSFFNTEKLKKLKEKYSVKQTENGFVIEKRNQKGTGGKPAYVSVILNEFGKTRRKLSFESIGFLMGLVECIEWNTGRIIRNHDGVPMTMKMICSYLDIGQVKFKKLMSELSENNVINFNHKKKAYFVNQNILRKGIKA